MPEETTPPLSAGERLYAALRADPPDHEAAREALAEIDAATAATNNLDGLLDNPPDSQAMETARAMIEAHRPRLHPMRRPDPLPPAPDWLLADRYGNGWLPDGRLAALSGDGALGKSHLSIALAAAVAGGGNGTLPLIPDADPRGGPARLTVRGDCADAIVATWEDDAAECWRRVHALHCGGARWADPKHLDDRLHFLRPDGPVWAARQRGNAAALAVLTPTGEDLLDFAAKRNARLIVLDPVAAAFGASEIDRAQVRAFCSHMDAWAREHRCAVLLVQHPPKAERMTGGQSGSTDWRNAPRAVLTLTLEPDPRDKAAKPTRKPENFEHPMLPTLTCSKSNYGKLPDPLTLKRRAGEGGMHWREIETPTSTKRPTGRPSP